MPEETAKPAPRARKPRATPARKPAAKKPPAKPAAKKKPPARKPARKRRKAPAAPPAPTPPAVSTVASAVLRDLAAIGERDKQLAEGTLAMSALRLAMEMDSKASGTSKSNCARALLDTMDKLWQLSPAPREDPIDRLAKKNAERQKRRGAGRAKAARKPRT